MVKQEQELMKQDNSKQEEKSLKIQQAYIKIDKNYNQRVRDVQSGMRDCIKQGLGKRDKPSQSMDMDMDKTEEEGSLLEFDEELLNNLGSMSLVQVLGLPTKKVKTDGSEDGLLQFGGEMLGEGEGEGSENICTTASQSVTEDMSQTGEHQELDLMLVRSLQQLVNLGGDYLKAELKRLGLKCGGTVATRAQRLWDIKLDPGKLFSPKYIAKKSKK